MGADRRTWPHGKAKAKSPTYKVDMPVRWETIGYGGAMAVIDTVILSLLKAKSLGTFDGMWIIVVSMAIYACQPLIFLQSLKYETLTVMNLVWDMASDVLVTLTGVGLFGEKLSLRRWAGVCLSFVSLCLLSC